MLGQNWWQDKKLVMDVRLIIVGYVEVLVLVNNVRKLGGELCSKNIRSFLLYEL